MAQLLPLKRTSASYQTVHRWGQSGGLSNVCAFRRRDLRHNDFLWLFAHAMAEAGIASVYAYAGQRTASGERAQPNGLTAAPRTLPFGTRVRATNKSNGRSVTVRINDRGPFVRGRVIDLSPAAAHALGFSGLARVTLQAG